MPLWLVKFLPFGLLLSLLAVVGVRMVVEHDKRVRAEQRATDLLVLDSVKTSQWTARFESDARRVDTLIMTTRATIAPTKEIIRTATERITDTLYVRAALDTARVAIDRCAETLTSCEILRRTSTATIDSLSRLLLDRDRDRINLFTKPSPPRFSRGVTLGVGYCIAADGRRNPCLSLAYGFHWRIF